MVRPPSPCPDLHSLRRVLLVDAGQALSLLSPQPGRQDVVFTQLSMLSAEMLGQVRPDGVIAPLITPGWDLVDLADRLTALGWSGTLFALTRPLPRRDLVMHEVGSLFPNLHLRLLEI